MSFHAAVADWEEKRELRDKGVDIALEKKVQRQATRDAREQAKQGAGGVLTVRQVCDLYLAGHIDLHRAEKGRKEIRRMFNTMLRDLANESAATLTRAQAFEFIQSYAHIPVQAQNLRRNLGSAWEYCHDAGELGESVPNWWREILRGKLKSKGKTINGERRGKVKRSLSPAEVGTLIRWMPNFTRDIEDFLMLYLWTGTRGAEIGPMRAEEISKEADGLWWTIPKAKTKNQNIEDATDHRVPLLGRAATIVRRRLDAHPTGWLFPSYGKSGHWEQKSIQTRVYYQQPYCQTTPQHKRTRLTVTHWAPHDLRRTARTFLAALGCPSDVGEVITGHVLKGVEGIYNRHTYDRERREWLTKLSDYLETLVAAS
jgi:integrase